MEKNPLHSKTIWGLLVLALLMILQTLGYANESVVIEVSKIIAGTLSVYGLRDAVGKTSK